MSLSTSSSDPSAEWHVLLRGERRGPFTPLAVRDLLETHPEGWSASVWRPGMLDWRPAQQIAALLQAAESAPAPSTRSMPSVPTVRPIRDAEAAFILTPSESELPVHTLPARARPAPRRAETTHDMPAYAAPRKSSRTLYYLLAIGALLSLSLLLLFVKWRSPVATHVPAAISPPPPPPAPLALPPSAVPAETAAQVRAESPRAAPSSQATSARVQTDLRVSRVRVRARWAPIRTAADPAAQVLCSLPRGTVLSVYGQRPGTHARWFAVRCDAQISGWVHENFLASVRP